MELFWIIIPIYCLGLFACWLWIAMDGCESVKEDFFNKSRFDELTTNEWLKICWVVFLWPIFLIIWYFKNGFIPTLKFFYKAIIFIFKFLFYPFTLIFNLIKVKKNPNKEPFRDKLGKFIVKLFKL